MYGAKLWQQLHKIINGIRIANTFTQVSDKLKYIKMEKTFYDRLLIEAQELASKTNALNDFMRTQSFVDLDRENKDLLYSQSRLMNEYLQILGKRIELLGEKFSF